MSQNINVSPHFIEFFFVRFLGVNRILLENSMGDKHILVTLGYQLFATLLLLFTLQYSAFLILTQSPSISALFAFLSSTIIISTDRILIASDWYHEGEYWHIKDNTDDEELLKKIHNDRLKRFGLRLLLGVFISFSIVSIATPALFWSEIRYGQQREKQVDLYENSLIDQEYKNKQDQLEALSRDIEDKKEVILQYEKETGRVRDDMSRNPFTKDDEANYQEALKDLENANVKAEREDNFATMEKAGGTRDGRGSGDPGPGDRYNDHIAKRDEAIIEVNGIDKRIDAFEAKKKEIVNFQMRINELTNPINSTQEEINNIMNERAQLKAELVNYKTIEKQKIITGERGAKNEEGGLKNVFDSYYKLKNGDESIGIKEATFDTHLMLFLIKIFAILLEIMVFLSKFFGHAREYSKAVYYSQRK